VNVNFNFIDDMPEICMRTAFCFKKQVLESTDANKKLALGDDQEELISRSTDTFAYPHVKF
jgi:hypothetical protein